MDPQSNTNQTNQSANKPSILENIPLDEKLGLLTKVKKYADIHYEGIVNEKDLAIAEKALDDFIKNTNK